MKSYLIDCSTCQAEPETCTNCLMTFVANPEFGQPVRFSEPEKQALTIMADAGLLPSLRLAS